jgi:hypothetical protein
VNTRFTPTFDAHFHAFVGANLVFARSLMVKIRIADLCSKKMMVDLCELVPGLAGNKYYLPTVNLFHFLFVFIYLRISAIKLRSCRAKSFLPPGFKKIRGGVQIYLRDIFKKL